MGAQLSIKVKANGKKAKQLAQAVAATPDASSGANYVSPGRLFVPPGASSGTPHGAERVPYKPRPDLVGGADDAQQTPEIIGADKALVRPAGGNEARQVGQARLSDPAQGVGYGYRPVSPEGPGPSYVGEGIDEVGPVARLMNPVERARQRNNRARDGRTNLGRGKPGIVEVEG